MQDSCAHYMVTLGYTAHVLILIEKWKDRHCHHFTDEKTEDHKGNLSKAHY